jgi:YidC/Oxa1 family membrane protein insertase
MGNLFNTLLVHPLLNLLVYMYHYIPDIGVVIILLTGLVRLILLPSFHKSLKHQRELQALQPKMAEIRAMHKDDQEKQAKAMMELYKVHKVNPLSSCLPIIIQLPLLFALYRVFIQSLNGQELTGLYNFVPNPHFIDPMFLNFVNLANHGNLYLAAAAAILQYIQTKMTQNKASQPADPSTKMLTTYMMYFLPAMTFWLGYKFPAGLALYWVTTTLFGIAQQYYIVRKEAKEALYGKQ